MLRRLGPYLIPAVVIAVGIGVLIRGFSLPEYSVPNGHDLLFNNSWQDRELQSEHASQVEQFEMEWNTLREKC